MERITSRKNRIISHLKALGSDRSYREETGLFLCDGEKLLREALASGAELSQVLWAEGRQTIALPEGVEQYVCPPELLQYASPMKNPPGPLFSVKACINRSKGPLESAIVLEGVQDPGNVGTVIRTAGAMGIGAVVLLSGCADPLGPKTVRSTMGAVFRQTVIETDLEGLEALVRENGLELWGAALSGKAQDIRRIAGRKALAIAIGSEGRGLSAELLSICEGELIIPMEPESESLNAAVAASIAMWEIYKTRREG